MRLQIAVKLLPFSNLCTNDELTISAKAIC